MIEKDREEVFKLLGAKGTKKILEFLNDHGAAQYKQMAGFMSTPTLNTRLRKLLAFGLIEHHLEREKGRKEWYELTEKGMEVLQCLRDMLRVMEGKEGF